MTKTDAVTAYGVPSGFDRSWAAGIQPVRVRSANGSRWAYQLAYEYAAVLTARTGGAPVTVDENGIEEWDYLTVTLVDEQQDFPIVRRTPDVETWEMLTYPRRTESDGFDVELQPLTRLADFSVVVALFTETPILNLKVLQVQQIFTLSY